jgi:hypothetical protein
MTREEKAMAYDRYIDESDLLQKINSKLKSQYPINVPADIQSQIDTNTAKINVLVKKLEDLFM